VTQSIFAEAAQFGALMQTQKNPGVAVGGWVISKKWWIRCSAKRDYPRIYIIGHYFTITPACSAFNAGATIKSLGMVMKQSEIKSLSIDELWMLHEAIAATLAEKITAEKKLLEKRLRLLATAHVEHPVKALKHRRPYPPVLPKFRNPDEPSETWAGRGKQPRWVRKQLRSGKRMDDFRIESVAA